MTLKQGDVRRGEERECSWVDESGVIQTPDEEGL